MVLTVHAEHVCGAIVVCSLIDSNALVVPIIFHSQRVEVEHVLFSAVHGWVGAGGVHVEIHAIFLPVDCVIGPNNVTCECEVCTVYWHWAVEDRHWLYCLCKHRKKSEKMVICKVFWPQDIYSTITSYLIHSVFPWLMQNVWFYALDIQTLIPMTVSIVEFVPFFPVTWL